MLKFFFIYYWKIWLPSQNALRKGVLWIYSFGYAWNIFILPFLNTLRYTLFKKYNVLHRRFMLELLPFRRGVCSFYFFQISLHNWRWLWTAKWEKEWKNSNLNKTSHDNIVKIQLKVAFDMNKTNELAIYGKKQLSFQLCYLRIEKIGRNS